MASGDIAFTAPRQVTGLEPKKLIVEHGAYVALAFKEIGGQRRFDAIARQGGSCEGFNAATGATIAVNVTGAYIGANSAYKTGGFKSLVQWFVDNGVIVPDGTVVA